MKTINFRTMIIAAIASLLFFTACKKDNPAPQPPAAKTMAGDWEGKYGNGNNEPVSYWAFQINKDGTIKLKTTANGAYKGNGTWTLTDNVFRATYKYDGDATLNFITAIVDVPTGVMAGKYSIGTEDKVKGDFNSKRK